MIFLCFLESSYSGSFPQDFPTTVLLSPFSNIFHYLHFFSRLTCFKLSVILGSISHVFEITYFWVSFAWFRKSRVLSSFGPVLRIPSNLCPVSIIFEISAFLLCFDVVQAFCVFDPYSALFYNKHFGWCTQRQRRRCCQTRSTRYQLMASKGSRVPSFRTYEIYCLNSVITFPQKSSQTTPESLILHGLDFVSLTDFLTFVSEFYYISLFLEISSFIWAAFVHGLWHCRFVKPNISLKPINWTSRTYGWDVIIQSHKLPFNLQQTITNQLSDIQGVSRRGTRAQGKDISLVN